MVRFVYRNYPLESIHPVAMAAGAAAECAGDQGKYWEMHDAIFANQSELTDLKLREHAKSLHLNEATFTKCIAGDVLAEIKQDQDEARRLGVESTPTFLIGRFQSDGTIKVTKRINGAVPYETFKATLKDSL